jgi:hypothetical protein
MKYWIDTEFDENGKTIELISIGIVSADKREYYAVSNEFDPKKCNDWVKANVLPHLPPRETWKPRWKIAEEIREFCSARGQRPDFWSYCSAYDWVVLCWLYGAMSKLPDGWPWYCNDIRQMQAELGDPPMPEQTGTAHDALADARWHKEAYEKLKAVADARKAAAVAAVNAMRG